MSNPPPTQMSPEEELQFMRGELSRLTLDNRILTDQLKRLSIDSLTGFFRRDLLHSHLAQVLRSALDHPAARQMLEGLAFEQLDERDKGALFVLIYFLDLAYLKLFNEVDYSLGDKVLRTLGEKLRPLMHIGEEHPPMVYGMNEQGEDTMVHQYFAARSDGDEAFLCFVDHPKVVDGIVEKVQKEMKLCRIDGRIPLPPRIDYGSCSLAEALTAAAVWMKTQGRSRRPETTLTLVKQIMLGMAQRREMRSKTYARLSLLARLEQMGTPEVFKWTTPYLTRGVEGLNEDRLRKIVAASKVEDIDTGRIEFDDALLDEGLRYAVDEVFEGKISSTERLLREVGSLDGEEHKLALLIDCAAAGDTDRFIDTIRKKGN